MATIATTHVGLNFSALAKPFTFIGKVLVGMSENNARVQMMRQLTALSDEELATRGLKREDIALHVFADKFYM